MTLAIALLVFASAVLIDFAETKYVCAVGRRDAHRAALWSITMYIGGCVGFVAVLDVSLLMMIPECLGLYAGTRLALRRTQLRAPA